GAPAWMVDSTEVARIEPELDLNGDWRAAWCSRDGAVDPAGTTRALIGGHAWHGGTIIAPANVTDIEHGSDGVTVKTDAGDFASDLIVVAAGVGAKTIGEMIGLGTELVRPATPGIIVWTRPMDRVLNTVCYTTDSHFHQLPDGRVMIGEKAGAPQTEQHSALLTGSPNTYPNEELAKEHATRVIATASQYVGALADAEVEKIGVGWRPLPLDGLPTIGHVPDNPRVYLASMHSGVTLAPIVGHLAAMEILDRVRVDLLDEFRVERFL
ncbi:MAG: NAD(P)/FAD-dependent oxidoreductase, partial [Woeseiaceae bacterium]